MVESAGLRRGGVGLMSWRRLQGFLASQQAASREHGQQSHTQRQQGLVV